jgi:hypothetical protein
MFTKRRPPVLLAKYPEPPVKKVKSKEEENPEEDDTEYTDDSEVERVKEDKEVKDQKTRKHPIDDPLVIPSAQDVKKQWQDALEVERSNFLKGLIHTFECNIKNYSSSFVVCYDVKYKWQHDCIEKLFKPKGYDVVYKNIQNYDEDRTCAEIRIPVTVDARQLFRV